MYFYWRFGVHFTMKDRVQKVILYAPPCPFSIKGNGTRDQDLLEYTMSIYLYMHCYYYKMQSKKILLHVQSILELIITFHTCFFSLFSLSPSSGSLQLIEGVSVDGNQLYKIIRIIIATHFPTSSFLYIHTLHSDVQIWKQTLYC